MTANDTKAFGWVLPCVRGIQSGREFYTAMLPFARVEKMFHIESAAQHADSRSQRPLNRRRAEDIAAYLGQSAKNYILPAVTAELDGAFSFVGDLIFDDSWKLDRTQVISEF